jgi:hypothetical protein
MRRWLFVVLLCILSVSGVHAQQLWGLSLLDPIQCGPPGSILTFHGTITNYAGVPLQGLLVVTAPGAHLSTFGFDPALSAALTGGVLPVEGFSGSIFYLGWTNDAPIGYQFTRSLEGSFLIPGATYESHAVEYTAGVCAGPVPEPRTLFLLAGGLVGLIVFRRLRG